MTAKTNTINCKQCGYVNEGERVYCHNCGTKLDRSLLPTDAKQEESLEKKQKRVRKVMSPSRGFFAGAAKMLILTLVWAVLAAAVIQIARPPDSIPPEPKKGELSEGAPFEFRSKLDDASRASTPAKTVLNEGDINNYLQCAIRSKEVGLVGNEVKFNRTFVNLDEGVCRITTQQSIFGYPVYGSVYYQLAIKNNKLQATNVGGHFGHLPVHPQIMGYLDLVFQKLWDSLSREKKLLDSFQSIEVHKDHIDVTSKPASR